MTNGSRRTTRARPWRSSRRARGGLLDAPGARVAVLVDAGGEAHLRGAPAQARHRPAQVPQRPAAVLVLAEHERLPDLELIEGVAHGTGGRCGDVTLDLVHRSPSFCR